MEKELSLKQLEEIKAKAAKIKEAKKCRRVFPIVVFGEEGDEKELYIGYFAQPALPAFSKYMTMSAKDAVQAVKVLAQECFLDGDKELIDDDSVFLYGTMAQVHAIIGSRQSTLVNL